MSSLDDEAVRWLVVIVVAACSRAPEILYPPVTGHQATPFSAPPPCQLPFVTEYVEGSKTALSGTVVDAAGKAVECMVSVHGDALVGSGMAFTDAAGAYRISQLPPGEYTLWIYYQNGRASHPLVILSGVESIDHTFEADKNCPFSTPCSHDTCEAVSQLQRDARTQ